MTFWKIQYIITDKFGDAKFCNEGEGDLAIEADVKSGRYSLNSICLVNGGHRVGVAEWEWLTKWCRPVMGRPRPIGLGSGLLGPLGLLK